MPVMGPGRRALYGVALALIAGARRRRAAVADEALDIDHRGAAPVAGAGRLAELSPDLRRHGVQSAQADRPDDGAAAAAGLVICHAGLPALAGHPDRRQWPHVRAGRERPSVRLRRRHRRRGVDSRTDVSRRRGHLGSLCPLPRRGDCRRHDLLGHGRVVPGGARRADGRETLGDQDRRPQDWRGACASAAHRRGHRVPGPGRWRPGRAGTVPGVRREDRKAAVDDQHRARSRRSGLRDLDEARRPAARRLAVEHDQLRPAISISSTSPPGSRRRGPPRCAALAMRCTRTAFWPSKPRPARFAGTTR